MYITADRNPLPPNSRKLKIFALISINFAHVVSKLWSIFILAKKNNFWGLRGISFFPFTTISCSPQRMHTQPKQKLHFALILIELNGYEWKLVINFVFALFPPDLEDLQAIHQGTFSLLTFLDTHTSDSYFMYFAKFYWINYANLWWL